MKGSSFTLNQKLAAVAVALGAVALFAEPRRGPVVTLDTRELAAIVEKEVDHVTPAELAAWIIEDRADYRLLDLRSEQEYAAYHIPTAENLPLQSRDDPEQRKKHSMELLQDAPMDMGLGIKREAPRHY